MTSCGELDWYGLHRTPNQRALLVFEVEYERRASHMGTDDRDLIRLRFLVRLFLRFSPTGFKNLLFDCSFSDFAGPSFLRTARATGTGRRNVAVMLISLADVIVSPRLGRCSWMMVG